MAGTCTRGRRPASLILLVVVAMAALPGVAVAQDGAPSEQAAWYTQPDFWIATGANFAGIALFVSRVHAPAAAPAFGYVTQGIGLPALAFGIADMVTGDAGPTTAGLLTYAAWAAGAALVDHVFQVEYRDPRRPGVLIPYVVGYYVGIGVLSATQLSNGYTPWIIAGATCILNVAASFYARARGAD